MHCCVDEGKQICSFRGGGVGDKAPICSPLRLVGYLPSWVICLLHQQHHHFVAEQKSQVQIVMHNNKKKKKEQEEQEEEKLGVLSTRSSTTSSSIQAKVSLLGQSRSGSSRYVLEFGS